MRIAIITLTALCLIFWAILGYVVATAKGDEIMGAEVLIVIPAILSAIDAILIFIHIL